MAVLAFPGPLSSRSSMRSGVTPYDARNLAASSLDKGAARPSGPAIQASRVQNARCPVIVAGW